MFASSIKLKFYINICDKRNIKLRNLYMSYQCSNLLNKFTLSFSVLIVIFSYALS